MNQSFAAVSQKAPPARTLGSCKCGGQYKRPATQNCTTVSPDTPVNKPNLAIYSQLKELAENRMPTWNSPDILTNYFSPLRLMTEAEITVRNISPDVPAINALVHYYLAPYGIGTRKILKTSRMVNLGPMQEVTLKFPLDGETLAGDPKAGVHVVIEHPHDTELINNQGSQVISGGYTSEFGRSSSIEIPVVNDSAFTQTISLNILPTDLNASLSFTSQVFAPYEQRMVTLYISVPSHIAPPASGGSTDREITVVGRLADNTVIGGITHILMINT